MPRRHPGWWWAFVAALVIVVIAGTLVFPKWRAGTTSGGQQYAQPFRIAGNFYYVGANDVASFLITSPEGHILIDGSYPANAGMILSSIRELGFRVRDVRIILNSEAHYDHAGALAELQDSTGAQLWSSQANAAALETGGADPVDKLNPMNLFVWTGVARYDPPRVDHIVKDGDTIRLGPIEVTAHLTPGHTRGCTSWTFPIHYRERVLKAVSACSLELLNAVRVADPQRYPGVRGDFERTFEVLRGLSADVWVTSHAREFGRYRKFLEIPNAKDPADPFIDPAGYMEYIDKGERRFREVLARQQGQPLDDSARR